MRRKAVVASQSRPRESRFTRAARLVIERDFRDCKFKKGYGIVLVRGRMEARYTGLLSLRRMGLPTDVAKTVLDDAFPPCKGLLFCQVEIRNCRHCFSRSCVCTDCLRSRRQMPRLDVLAKLGGICGAEAVAVTTRLAVRHGGVDELRERVIRGLQASIQKARDI